MLTKDPLQRVGWMQLFQLKINNQGFIQETKQAPKISSLNDAKISEENSTQSNSAKFLPHGSNVSKVQNQTSDELDGRNFKKNRNTTPVIATKE